MVDRVLAGRRGDSLTRLVRNDVEMSLLLLLMIVTASYLTHHPPPPSPPPSPHVSPLDVTSHSYSNKENVF